MRTVLIVLLGFVAGVLLTLAIGSASFQLVTDGALAPGTSAPTGSSPSAASDTAAETWTVEGGPARYWPENGPSPEQVLYAQADMVRSALANLTPRVPGTPNLYVLAFAGDGAEDVFRNEAEYAGQLFTQRFGATTHTVILENHPATLSSRPLASWSNLEAALDGLARVMQPEQDILLLYVTTHGDEDHNLLIDMEPLPLDQIGAGDLGGILGKYAFKWKVVVVNACYSGGFIPLLRGPGTLVLTSARTDRSSFGCGSASDVTYFGKAWLVDGLNATPDFVDAFQRAKQHIAAWEQQSHLTASEPQMAIGSGIAAQLALWRKGITPGPVVPFAPPAAPDTHAVTQ